MAEQHDDEVGSPRTVPCKLDDLLELMIVETFPEEGETGPTVGQEIW